MDLYTDQANVTRSGPAERSFGYISMIEVRELLLDRDLFRKKSILSTQLIGHAQINRNIMNRVITTSHHIDRIGRLYVSVDAL